MRNIAYFQVDGSAFFELTLPGNAIHAGHRVEALLVHGDALMMARSGVPDQEYGIMHFSR